MVSFSSAGSESSSNVTRQEGVLRAEETPSLTVVQRDPLPDPLPNVASSLDVMHEMDDEIY